MNKGLENDKNVTLISQWTEYLSQINLNSIDQSTYYLHENSLFKAVGFY